MPGDDGRLTPIVSNEVWAGFLRGGPEHFGFGDPVGWSIPYRTAPGRPGVAETCCATPENTKAFREIRRALAALGFKEVGWHKIDKQGRMVWRQFDCLTGKMTAREVV